MPFQSKSQQRWMFAKHPSMAKRWAKETPNMKRLPEKADDEDGEDSPCKCAVKGLKRARGKR